MKDKAQAIKFLETIALIDGRSPDDSFKKTWFLKGVPSSEIRVVLKKFIENQEDVGAAVDAVRVVIESVLSAEAMPCTDSSGRRYFLNDPREYDGLQILKALLCAGSDVVAPILIKEVEVIQESSGASSRRRVVSAILSKFLEQI